MSYHTSENMKPQASIKILPLKSEDFIATVCFLQKYFFPEEPMNSSTGRTPQLGDSVFKDLLKDNMSFKAIDELNTSEDNWAGVVINKEASLSKRKTIDSIECPKTRKIFKILEKLDEESKFWEKVKCQDHFHILFVSVRNQYRGLNIGEKLVEESLKHAKSLNYEYASIECSSFYSSRFAHKMGFELIGKIFYDDYRDENNEQLFKISNPHTGLEKLIKKL